MNIFLQRMWGGASGLLASTRRTGWADLLVLAGVAGAVLGVLHAATEWTGVLRASVQIDLSPFALPAYTLLSLSRGLAAYVLSLLFTLLYGYWAAKDRTADRVLIPLLDILQSIPVLGFMPGLVLALVALFPHSNAGLELAAVLMIFTGQAWNMTFSFYYSLRGIPADQREVASVYRFTWWQRLKWVELPFSTIGLVWNSMMSMAGGWFFLMISEAFVLGDKDFRLPGLGSYMSVAVAKGDRGAMLWAVLAMAVMVITLDQLLWRPVVVWAQKFRVEEGGQAESMHSWFLDLLRRSRLLRWVRRLRWRKIGSAGLQTVSVVRAQQTPPAQKAPSQWARALRFAPFAALIGSLTWGLWKLALLLREVPAGEWKLVLFGAGLTLGRVLFSTALGTLWTLPAGLAIGLSPRLSRLLQPVVQVLASFPAPMLFPAVVAVLRAAGVTLGVGSMVLMLLGTQWYILFNVIAGATAVPADLREAARSYRIKGWQLFISVYFPSVFPYLVTGWVTAAGGAWNASIVSEYITFRGEVLSTQGLGAQISRAAASAQFPVLAASVVVMSLVVVTFNRLVWKPLHHLAETRFSLSK